MTTKLEETATENAKDAKGAKGAKAPEIMTTAAYMRSKREATTTAGAFRDVTVGETTVLRMDVTHATKQSGAVEIRGDDATRGAIAKRAAAAGWINLAAQVARGFTVALVLEAQLSGVVVLRRIDAKGRISGYQLLPHESDEVGTAVLGYLTTPKA